MSFLSFLQLPYTAVVFYVLPYLLALIIIIFVHELGHFLVGRWCGVNIEAFSIGFGKEIIGFNDRYGTRWKFCWIPLGGYVRFEGDANAASMPDANVEQKPGSLHAAALWKRVAIVSAGPIANFLLAIVIFASAYSIVGTPVSEPRVDDVVAEGAAKAAGLQSGDYIRTVDGHKVSSFSDIQDAMILHGEQPVALEIERGGSMLNMSIVPKVIEMPDGFGSTVRVSQIGVIHDANKDAQVNQRLSPPAAVAKGVERTWFIAKTTLRYLGKIILGSERSNQLHGPAGVVKIAGDYAAQGIWAFVTFIALISVSIGLVNLFPIPMLDGGHLAFYAIEGLLGKPVGPAAQEWSFRIGLSAILMLMVFVTINDVIRYATMQFGT
jgi:regulator of sigma E protease